LYGHLFPEQLDDAADRLDVIAERLRNFWLTPR